MEDVYCALTNNQPVLAKGIIQGVITDIENNFGNGYKTYKKNDFLSALYCYLRYIEHIIASNTQANLVNDFNIAPICNVTKNQSIKLIGTIDAMDMLISISGGLANFIKLAVENSFFFPNNYIDKNGQKLPWNQYMLSSPLHARLCNQSKNPQTAIPAGSPLVRGGNAIFTDGSYTKQITIDGNGNASVCKLLHDLTGYYYSGLKNNFRNYIISHIWGNAIDPRYFTSLWNLVLVPAWANYLLELNGAPGSTASIFKATFMKLCEVHYGMNSIIWAPIMSQPTICNPQDIMHGVHNINVIGYKQPNNLPGNITKTLIKI